MNNQELKPVIIRLPAHIADLINATREHLPGVWEEWAASPMEQSLERDSFEVCVREFDSLFVDGRWDFDGPADRAAFVAPLVAALRKAYDRHSATPRAEALTA